MRLRQRGHKIYSLHRQAPDAAALGQSNRDRPIRTERWVGGNYVAGQPGDAVNAILTAG
ncbi:hypothetical protein [Mesorhizobium sp. M0213]|uniref:hypothetical protein n=1 Tax=Mesorhizobium sp. M0213 TaxID=2956917 RepID=UPI00333B5DB8